MVRYSVFGFMIAVHDMWYVVVCGCGLFVIRVNYGVFFCFSCEKVLVFFGFQASYSYLCGRCLIF